MIGMFLQIFAFRIKMLNGDLCAGLIVHTKISEGLLVELVGTISYSGLNRTFISKMSLLSDKEQESTSKDLNPAGLLKTRRKQASEELCCQYNALSKSSAKVRERKIGDDNNRKLSSFLRITKQHVKTLKACGRGETLHARQ